MFLDIFLFILSGVFLRVLLTLKGVSPEKIDYYRDRINYIVFYYIIPFVCFKTTYTMPFSLSHLKVSLVANLTIISCVLVSWLIYKKINLFREIKSECIGAFIVCSAFGNVLYMGLPILTKLYGNQGMSYAFTYDLFASTPLTWTLAVAICMKYGRAKSIKLKDSIVTIIKIPPIWGLFAGLIFREIAINIPEELINLISLVSKYITFLMLFVVGISIKAVAPKRFILSLPAILVKVVISPLFALLYGKIFGLTGIPLNVCIVEAGMPSMLLSMLFATVFGIDMRTSIEMIFLTTVLSLLIFGFSLLFFQF
ncbi:MAG: AEC family transporter [Thermodesulfovibrio sp.]|nr:AEC family transporter [Thermodesulfovibrio sp.]MCX7724146.1 AEC family transporter [Thermodesulfovibrio sp.]MDW7971820.1 AEC family transporter [Thermodesulfovibrio sp.]